MKTFDSTLAYYVNQLDNLDKKLYEPLYNVTWGRDIKLRTGISMANESTSFIRSQIGGVGSQNATGKPWLAPNSTTLPGVSVNGERIVLRILRKDNIMLRLEDLGFLPAALIRPAHDALPIRQDGFQRGIGGARTPLRHARRLRRQVHRAARVKTGCQRGTGIETVALVVISAGAASGDDVRFQHRDLQPGARQNSGGSQPAHACADDQDALYFSQGGI